MSAYRVFAAIALLLGVSMCTNITLLDPSKIVQLDSTIRNKTDLCNELKSKRLSKLDVMYIVESNNEDNVAYFNKKVAEAQANDVQLNPMQFILQNSKQDDSSFLVCLQTLKSHKLSVFAYEQSKIEQIFAGSPHNTIIMFEDATAANFMLAARVLAHKTGDVAVHANKNVNGVDPTDPFKENSIDTEAEGYDAKDEDSHNVVQASAATVGKISIGPEGVMGIALALTFILVLIAYFSLMLQSADFNPKFIKEKLPQGKEY